MSQPKFRMHCSSREILVSAFAAFILTQFAPALADDDSGNARELLRTINKSRLIDLSHTWDKNSPIASVNPTYSFSLQDTHANTLNKFNDGGQLTYASEVMHFSGQHGAPTLDAIGHIGRGGKLLGGSSRFPSS